MSDDIDHIRFDESWKKYPCIEWEGALDRDGYGKLKVAGIVVGAHILALEERIGRRLTKEERACHYCDNRKCYNGKHLFPGTHEENMRDMVEKGRSAKGDRNGRRKMKLGVPLNEKPKTKRKNRSDDNEQITELGGW